MPVKRLAKRPSTDDSASGPSKRKVKGKKEPTYDTYDEALEGGIEMEEKGERYKSGEKAHRFYDKAVELYKKALEFQQTYDAAYNLARVYYTLSTSFLLPPEANTQLTESIKLYQLAISLATSPLLQLDALFNMAQSYTSLADILEDVTPVPSARLEARDALDKVLASQVEYLQSTAAAQEPGEGEAMTDEAVEQMEGDAADPASQGGDGDAEMDVDEEGGADGEGAGEGGGADTFETYLPTPSSVIDTILALVDIHLALWESKTPSQPPTEEEQVAVRQILDQAAAFITPGRQAEVDLAEIQVLLTMDRIIWDMFGKTATPGSASERSLEGAISALSALLASLDTAPPEEPTVRADILTTLADTHSTVAGRMTTIAEQLPAGPSAQGQQAWYHLGQAITHLNTALNLPLTANTPREFKPSVLLSLSQASLHRAGIANINDAAKRNLDQLMENAVTYARRAGEAFGLDWIKADFETVPEKVDLPYPAGWDAELLIRTIWLQQVRNCMRAGKFEMYAEDSPERKKWENRYYDSLKAGMNIADEERKPAERDIERFVDQVLEDGFGTVEYEGEGWYEVEGNLVGFGCH